MTGSVKVTRALLIVSILAIASFAAAGNNSEQVIFSGTGFGTFTPSGGSPTNTPFGFWIWCETDSGNGYLGECHGAMYFYALGMSKSEFLAATAFTFLIYKVVQVAAVAWYGLLTSALAATSLALTGIALAGFVAGLWIQDRLDQRAFNRAVLALLGALGLWLVLRGALA